MSANINDAAAEERPSSAASSASADMPSPTAYIHQQHPQQATSPGSSLPLSTAASATNQAALGQPKVNQSAFIHKLYNMLEDTTISHLISWTPAGDSFVVSPNEEFSKVLSLYFKHTNVSSFVRQLNMYGFHKVNDVFHAGATADSGQWEFKHGNGIFKRGDVDSLRGIKRRASRQSIVHRDSTSSKAGSVSLPVTPVSPRSGMLQPTYITDNIQPVPVNPPAPVPIQPPETTDALRLATLESTMWRLQDSHLRLQVRSDMVLDSVRVCQEWLRNLISIVSRLPFGPELASVETELRQLHDDIGRRGQLLSDDAAKPDMKADNCVSPLQRPDNGRNSVFRQPYPTPQENLAPAAPVTSVPPHLQQPYQMRRPGSYPSPNNTRHPAIRRHASSETAGGEPHNRSWSDVSTSTDSSDGLNGSRRSLPGVLYSTDQYSQPQTPMSPSSVSLSPLHQPFMRRDSVNPAVQFSSVNQYYRLHPASPKLTPTSAPIYGPTTIPSNRSAPSMQQQQQQRLSPQLQQRPQPRPHQQPGNTPRQSVGVGVHSLLNPLEKEDRIDTESPPLSPLSTGRKRRKD